MPVHERTYKSGHKTWYYQFDLPGSTKKNRLQVKESGFAKKKEAVEAEAKRRIEVQREYEAQQRTGKVEIPRTLETLLPEFFERHGSELAPKTLERYREMAPYLSDEFSGMPLDDLKPLDCTREWARLVTSGGRGKRKGKPLSAKTSRNIASMVSQAFRWAIQQGVCEQNPVANSKLPRWKKGEKTALLPAQTHVLAEAAGGPWCMTAFLEISAATGARRGEVLALEWTDLENGVLTIRRSLCQTKAGLVFKAPKNGKTRQVILPQSAVDELARHRAQQDEFRRQFAADYQGNLIFCHENGAPFRPDSISASVSALFKRLKIKKPKGAALHLLRHTHGSQMLAAGVPITDVAKRLGHLPETLMRDYAHALDGRDEEAVRRWERFQGEKLEKADRKTLQ